MRFEFCGKLDCPDWILAQLFHASQLELRKFGLLCNSVKDSIVADGKFDEILFEHLELDDEKFDIDDARACFASVNFIITSASLHQVGASVLRVELEQLGLPSDHCELLCRVFDDSQEDIMAHLSF